MKFIFRLLILAAMALPVSQLATLDRAFADSATCVSCANFAQVTGQIFRGGRPGGENSFQELKAMGIKTVIDLQGGDIGNSMFGWVAGVLEPGENPSWISFEKQGIESLGMKFVNVPINSLADINSAQGYGLGHAIALMNDPKNQPVYVHCEHGVDRTGLLVALYRVYYQKWTREAAHDEMVAMGHGFFRQLFTGDMDEFFWAATKGMP